MHLFTSQVFSAIVLYSSNSSVSLKTQDKQEFRTNCGNMYKLKLLFLKAYKNAIPTHINVCIYPKYQYGYSPHISPYTSD